MNTLAIEYIRHGFKHTLTLADADSSELMRRGDLALTWLQANDAQPVATPAAEAQRAPVAATNGNGNGHAPVCPTHNTPMKPSKHGGYYCTAKVADDDGTGKAVYCRQKA